MKRLYFIISLSVIVMGCNEQIQKKYEDYNEEDFIEVQGIITKTIKKYNYQNMVETDIYYIYDLGKEKPTKGYELKAPYMPIEGAPAIILVHKDDKNVTFFARSGILDEGEKVLLDYLKKCEEIGGGYYGLDDY